MPTLPPSRLSTSGEAPGFPSDAPAPASPQAVPVLSPAAVDWNDPAQVRQCTRERDAADGQRLAETSLVIQGMYCAACSLTIEAAVSAVPGVQAAEVQAGTGRASVTWDPSVTTLAQVAAAVQRAGYRALPSRSPKLEAARRAERRQTLWRLFVAGFCMMQVMMYAVPSYYATPGDMTDDVARLLQWASWLLSIPVLVFAAVPFLRGAWADVSRRRIGMDVPVALGIVVTFVASTAATFHPGSWFGDEVYFDSLTMFVFFLLCGRYLEQRARAASLDVLESLLDGLPETARRVDEHGQEQVVPTASLVPGDRIVVRAGETFPVDAVLLSGRTQVDEALLTGESRPVAKQPGDAVVAGSGNLSAPVTLRVERVGEDTRHAGIVALVERAAVERPAWAQAVDRIAAPFLWCVLLAAAGSALAWWWIDPHRTVWVAVSVLIVTCPCALSLATPSALLAATGALARRGVLVQRLAALESLAHADVAVFDKTGTLTSDELALAGMAPEPGWRADQVLGPALALARASLHPVSRALAAAHMQAEPLPLDEVQEAPGQGVTGRDAQGRCWRLGARAFACAAMPVLPQDGDEDEVGQAECWLGVDGQAVARFAFDERLRPDAAATVAGLRERGLRVVLLSGDRDTAAQRVAQSLGIAEVHARATPEDKLALVAAEQAAGRRVLMVGDGLNDGPVLARADVSIAMGQGAPLARVRSDLTLLSGRLQHVVEARDLARRTLSVIRQNLAWSAAYNGVSIPLALAGWMPPWLAGLGMATSSLVVVANAWRLGRSAQAPDAPAQVDPPLDGRAMPAAAA